MTETFMSKLSREGELLSSMKDEVPKGIHEAVTDAWEHKARTAFELASAVAVGSAFTLISRNPNQMVQTATKYLGYSFVGLAAADLGSRFYVPMNDGWHNPGNLEQNKKILGQNVGDAVFNYGLAVVGGGAGAAFGERYLESTKIGEFLSGQKVTHFDGNSPPASVIESKFKAHGVRPSKADSESLLPSSSPGHLQYTMRQFNDGSSLITASDGTGILRHSSGPELWFKSKQNWWSMQPEVELLPNSPFSPRNSSQFLQSNGALKFLAPNSGDAASAKLSVDVRSFTNRFYPWEKGSEGGLGAIASQWALERAGDIGTALLQHWILVKYPGSPEDDKSKSKH